MPKNNMSLFIRCLILYGVIFSPALATEKIIYEVKIIGVTDESLHNQLLTYSQTYQQQDTHSNSLFILKQRAKKDVLTFIQLLRAKAYYEAKIRLQLKKKKGKIKLIFHVNVGQQYHLQHVTIDQKTTHLKKPNLKLQLNTPALTSTILAAEQQLLEYAKNKSYAFAKLCSRKIIVNHDSRGVNVNLCLKTGNQVRIGRVQFTGNTQVNVQFLKDLIQWQQGMLYDQKVLEDQRLKLVNSRLFAVARVHLAIEVDENGQHPITFELTQRLPRTISTGVRLTTDKELFLAHIGWEHRNLWHQGETLEANLNVSMIKSSLNIKFRQPVFYQPENTLVMNGSIVSEETDAFESLRTELLVAIERQISLKKRINLGLSYRFSQVTVQNNATENFNLMSLPFIFSWDLSDHPLEPTSGGRLWIEERPFYDVSSSAYFYKQKIQYNHYLTLIPSKDLILAGRLIIGNIWGANMSDIPADLRYFAGGGDTVRGFSFQSLSPKDHEGRLLGGRSLFALSMELRAWVTPNIGVVGFMDAGRAYHSIYQKFSQLRIGVGLGLRYKTPIGALRLDFARAIDKRPEDDEFQVYISIGHTF